ncbi:MAG: hypothetical protein KDH09_16975 [Chrysiogenetes bacterium]|nr:hypothetical protein [Chrysiogenetes bacterium]
MAASTKMPLGEMLVRAGVIDELQLKSALARQRDHGGKLGRSILALGFTNQRMLGRALAKQFGVPFMDLTVESCDLMLLQKFPERMAVESCALPFKREGKTACVVIADPGHLTHVDEITRVMGPGTKFFVAPEHLIFELIDRAYRAFEYGGLVLEPLPENANVARSVSAISLEESDQNASYFPGKWVDAGGADAEPAAAPAASEFESLRDEVTSFGEEHAIAPAMAAELDAAPDLQARQILLFDTDAHSRLELRLALRGEGYEVRDVKAIARIPEKLKLMMPDLIVLEVGPSTMQAAHLVQKLKTSVQYSMVPVILLSEYFRDWRAREDLCDLTGAQAVLAKPVRPGEFIAVMRRVWGEEGDEAARRKAQDMLAEGREHYERGEVEDALENFRAAAEHDPQSSEPHQTLAIALENSARPFEAIAAYERAARLDPGNFLIFKKLSQLYEGVGLRCHASEALERAARTCPNPQVKERIVAYLLNGI